MRIYVHLNLSFTVLLIILSLLHHLISLPLPVCVVIKPHINFYCLPPSSMHVFSCLDSIFGFLFISKKNEWETVACQSVGSLENSTPVHRQSPDAKREAGVPASAFLWCILMVEGQLHNVFAVFRHFISTTTRTRYQPVSLSPISASLNLFIPRKVTGWTGFLLTVSRLVWQIRKKVFEANLGLLKQIW